MKKKTIAGERTLSDFKDDWQATVNIWVAKLIGKTEIDPCIRDQMIFNKNYSAVQRRKKCLFKWIVLGQLENCKKNIKLNLTYTSYYTKKLASWIVDLTIKLKTIKLLDENRICL